MSTSNVDYSRLSEGSFTSHLLREAKTELEDLALGGGTTLVQDEINAVERDDLERLRLTRCWKNGLAPISRIPPELLVLIPDFLEERDREEIVIPLTHVCRAWREIFTTRSSLWTNFRCVDDEKTRVYLERSKSSPIKLWLNRSGGLLPEDPSLQFPPHAISRLTRLLIWATSNYLHHITDRLSLPTPLLQDLYVAGVSNYAENSPVLPPTLFSGVLPSLRRLDLRCIHTDLPWRNMLNLTSFSLCSMPPPGIPTGNFLDFFESTPRLLDVELSFATPTLGAQPGRLVSLPYLRTLGIFGFQPTSLFLEHLLVPVGAEVETSLPSSRIVDHLPRLLDNLRNLSNFTAISVDFKDLGVIVKLTGPNGQVCMHSLVPQSPPSSYYLAQLDTSKIEGLKISNDDPAPDDFYQALSPMANLRTLTLSFCKNIPSFILALNPDPGSTGPIPCPDLERLVIHTDERFDIESVVMVAAARASRGVPLKVVKITGSVELVPTMGVADLRKYVPNVEAAVEIGDAGDDKKLRKVQ